MPDRLDIMLFFALMNASFTGLAVLFFQRSKKILEQIDESFAKFYNNF